MKSRVAVPLALAAALLVAASSARAGEKPRRRKLARDETVKLFAGLSEAVKTATTFRSPIRRKEESVFVDDVLLKDGTWSIKRRKSSEIKEKEAPLYFRQEFTRPRKGSIIIGRTDLWIHLPDSKEAHHLDLAKDLKGKANATLGSFTPWLYFDLDELEKTWKVTVSTDKPPEGVTVRKAKSAESAKPDPDAKGKAPEKAYKIELVPRKAKLAPEILKLTFWVDGENPWPLRIVRETPDDDIITTDFSDVVLDAEIDDKIFNFKPPRGTKVVELGE